MPRIVAGASGGRRLLAPPGKHTRPTSDRVKEALFSSLGDLTGTVVLDLYAGSGQLGIEALSRGAERAVFVERHRRAVEVIKTNLATAGSADQATVVHGDVAAWARSCDPEVPFDVIFADPPYAVAPDALGLILDGLVRRRVVTDDAVVVVERDRRSPMERTECLKLDRVRAYGDTVLCVLSLGVSLDERAEQ